MIKVGITYKPASEEALNPFKSVALKEARKKAIKNNFPRGGKRLSDKFVMEPDYGRGKIVVKEG